MASKENRVWTIVFVVFVIACAAVVAARFGFLNGFVTIPNQVTTTNGSDDAADAYLAVDDSSELVDSLGPRKWKIIDVHEHLLGEAEAIKLLAEMDKFHIQRTCLMASSKYTLTLNPIYGFEALDENNQAILAVKKKWPDRFAAFITIDPLVEGNLQRVKDYVAQGADGIKLYFGHGAKTGKGPFHSMPLDDPRMDPVFAYAEETQLPLVFHINLNQFWDETVRLLEKHPYLRVDIPHFGLHKNSENKLKRLAWLLDRYPHVFTDVSFGHQDFQTEGYEQLARQLPFARNWMITHKERMLFASDMVLEPSKDQPYMENTVRAYLQFLERVKFRSFLVPKRTTKGMGLDDDTLSWIYEKAPKNFLMLDDAGNLPDRTKGWPPTGFAVPTRAPIPPFDPASIPRLGGGKKKAVGNDAASDKTNAPPGGEAEHDCL